MEAGLDLLECYYTKLKMTASIGFKPVSFGWEFYELTATLLNPTKIYEI